MNYGGTIRAKASVLGVKEDENFKKHPRGYIGLLRCKCLQQVVRKDVEGNEFSDMEEVTRLSKNKWYTLVPKSQFKTNTKDHTYFISPTEELLEEGIISHLGFAATFDEIFLKFKSFQGTNLDDIEHHLRVLVMEPCE